MEENLKSHLDNFIGKNIVIKQEGFINAKFSVKKMKYLIEEDILSITGEENKNYLQININQIHNIETEADKIIFSLDNDLDIVINV